MTTRPSSPKTDRSRKTPRLVAAALGLSVCLSALPAQADTMLCQIGEGPEARTLAVEIKAGRKLNRSRTLELRVAAEDLKPIEAVAAFNGARTSLVKEDFIRIVFPLTDAIDFSLMIAPQGDSYGFAHTPGSNEPLPDSGRLGFCDAAPALFARWR